MVWATEEMSTLLLAWERILAFHPVSLAFILVARSLKAAILVLGMQKGKPRCFSLWEHSKKFRKFRMAIFSWGSVLPLKWKKDLLALGNWLDQEEKLSRICLTIEAAEIGRITEKDQIISIHEMRDRGSSSGDFHPFQIASNFPGMDHSRKGLSVQNK